MTAPVDPRIQRLLMMSPRLAYAEVMYGPLVPYPFTITANFTAAGTPAAILDQVSGDDPIDRDLLIEGVDVDIQTPNFNTASLFKPEADLAYDFTSGIETTITQRGAFGRQYDQIPLKALPKVWTEGHPGVLLTEQTLLMSFYVTTPLPSNSTIITVTFLAMTSLKDRCFRMGMDDVFKALDEAGYFTERARAVFLSAN
ncbi:MAG: hypothetical protein KGI71_04780 [Patescibacteria group bacterium]|nr:hypothetical protein [Patescibacteria group bacterium]